MTSHQDTIVAVATPPGRGGIGIIRVSGDLSAYIATAILGELPSPRKATYTEFKSSQQEILDSGIALYFPAPHSFTGEHVLEFQGHGGPVVLDMVLKHCLSLGARLARPGEFSERAFLNDKLDLAQAEAISDLIDSSSEQAARSALRSLQGHFSAAIETLLQELIELRVYVEAALDFPDEEINFLADKAVTDRLERIKLQLHTIFSKAKNGSLLREGMQLVIVGKPNAGKSSLLNALSGNDTAIVTAVAGTTRDVLRETISLDGMPLHIIDTAGLRESNDPVEKIGIQRAWQEIKKADLILLLMDGTDNQHNNKDNQRILERLPNNLPLLQVYNKIDLNETIMAGWQNNKLYISAKQQLGINALKDELKQRMGYQSEVEDSYIARRRHLQALTETQQAVDEAERQLKEYNAGELMAEELRIAQDTLGQITGRYTPDDLLGEIFSNFCIGK